MTKIMDGPAANVTLMLKRSPLFLRVVINSDTGEIDALDQLDDKPKPDEEIYVYRKTKVNGHAHVCIRGKGRNGSGFYEDCEYHFNLIQPPTDIARDTWRWQEWCFAQPEAKCEPTK